jgi:hypothetical protein
MQVHDLHSTRRNNTHIRALTNVIGGVGRPSFAGSLFAFAHQLIGADHVKHDRWSVAEDLSQLSHGVTGVTERNDLFGLPTAWPPHNRVVKIAGLAADRSGRCRRRHVLFDEFLPLQLNPKLRRDCRLHRAHIGEDLRLGMRAD